MMGDKRTRIIYGRVGKQIVYFQETKMESMSKSVVVRSI